MSITKAIKHEAYSSSVELPLVFDQDLKVYIRAIKELLVIEVL